MYKNKIVEGFKNKYPSYSDPFALVRVYFIGYNWSRDHRQRTAKSAAKAWKKSVRGLYSDEQLAPMVDAFTIGWEDYAEAVARKGEKHA